MPQVKIEPKVFVTRKHMFLMWMHEAVVLVGASVVIAALLDAEDGVEG